jgi:hypothetical protein
LDQPPERLDEDYLEKLLMMKEVAKSDAGINVLRWVCRLSGFNKPSMTMEDAARRDLWLTIRRFIAVEQLSLIEHHDLREQQAMVQATIDEMMRIEEEGQDE